MKRLNHFDFNYFDLFISDSSQSEGTRFDSISLHKWFIVESAEGIHSKDLGLLIMISTFSTIPSLQAMVWLRGVLR